VAHSLNSALLKIKGLGEAKVAKMKEAAKKLVPMGFTTAAEYHKHRQELIQVND
jgi:DNA repair protein RAD51